MYKNPWLKKEANIFKLPPGGAEGMWKCLNPGKLIHLVLNYSSLISEPELYLPVAKMNQDSRFNTETFPN